MRLPVILPHLHLKYLNDTFLRIGLILKYISLAFERIQLKNEICIEL